MPGRVTTKAGVERLVIRESHWRIVRVGDVAKVVDGEKDTQSLAQYDGKEVVLLSVVKQSGTNTIQVTSIVAAK